MSSHQLVEIDVHRHWQGRRIRRHVEGLTGAHCAPIAGFRVESDPGRAFQGGQLALPLDSFFKDHRRSGYRDGHRAAPDGTAARVLWHPQQDRTAIDVRGPSALVESKNRVRAETRDREIRKRKFGARVAPCSHASLLGYLVVQGGGARVGVGRQEINLANDLGDAGFLRRRARHRGNGQDNRDARKCTGQKFRGGFHKTASFGDEPRMSRLRENVERISLEPGRFHQGERNHAGKKSKKRH